MIEQMSAVEIVIPVHNEQHALERSVRALHAHMMRELGLAFTITVVDNASGDATFALAQELARELPEVSVLRLELKGRGRALRAAWAASNAEVLVYMDVDLSTDLAALAPLLEPLLAGRADLAIGSRLAPGARVQRCLKRELISRAYNLLLRTWLGTSFSDAQCGFKAGRRAVLQELLSEVRDESWFFDTELLYRAQRRKFAIREVPVRWIEDRDSRVYILATAREDIEGIRRLRAEERTRRARAAEGALAPPPDLKARRRRPLRERARLRRRRALRERTA